MMGRLSMKMVNYRLHVPTYATQSKKIALPPLARRGLAFVVANHMPAMLDGGGHAVQAHHIRLRRLSRHRQRGRGAFADLSGDAAASAYSARIPTRWSVLLSTSASIPMEGVTPISPSRSPRE